MRVYLDYNANTPLDPDVFGAMRPFLTGAWGNASSFHQRGQAARHAVEEAREQVAAALEVEPGDLIFTSGGTEADNLAVRGVIMQRLLERRHLAVSAVEHQAVLHTAVHLEKRKCPLTVVPVNADGTLCLEALEKAVTDQTALVSLMHVNNETGVIQPVEEAARIAHARGALFHVDAVQSFGKLPVRPEAMGADLVSLSSHKICGPQGAGALYLRKGVKIEALFHGGHQEKNIRPGTENVAAIAGFGAAARLAESLRIEEGRRVAALRDRLAEGLSRSVKGIRLNGSETRRIHNTLNVSFEGIDGETLLMNLDLAGIEASTGSACTAGSVEPSHVLLAMGIPEKLARASIRFSLGRFTTADEIDYVLATVPALCERLRRASTENRR